MQKTYIAVSGMKIKCSFGSQKAVVRTAGPKAITINGHNVVSQADCIPEVNIGCLGTCHANPDNPVCCHPEGVWLYPFENMILNDDRAITTDSVIVCPRGGGIITIDI